MTKYTVKYVKEDTPVVVFKKNEMLLKDLLDVMPTLKKHKLEGEIHTKVKRLRDGRRQKHYTLEVTRKFPTTDKDGIVHPEIKVSKLLTKGQNRVEVLKELKEQILGQIKAERKKNKPPIEDYTFHEGVKVKKLELCYLEPGAFSKLAVRRVRTKMSSPKMPDGLDKYIGIEIEILSKEDREKVMDAIFEAGIGKHVHVKHDGSIKVTKEYPNEQEITVLVKETEYKDVLTKLCHCLNRVLHCTVNKSCGLHVHLDMRHREPQVPFANLVTLQNFLYSMCPAERKNSTYSVPIKDKKWNIARDHYNGISNQPYQKQKTIEIRMHCGTTQAKKINSWIELLLAIVNAPAIDVAPKTVEALAIKIGLNNDIVKYMNERISKFAGQHKATPKGEAAKHLEEVIAVAVPPAQDNVDEDSEVA